MAEIIDWTVSAGLASLVGRWRLNRARKIMDQKLHRRISAFVGGAILIGFVLALVLPIESEAMAVNSYMRFNLLNFESATPTIDNTQIEQRDDPPSSLSALMLPTAAIVALPLHGFATFGPIISEAGMLAIQKTQMSGEGKQINKSPLATGAPNRSPGHRVAADETILKNASKTDVPETVRYIFDLPGCKLWKFSCMACEKRNNGVMCQKIKNDCEESYTFFTCAEFDVPKQCRAWRDGCNTCRRDKDGVVLCTMMGCEEYHPPGRPSFDCLE